VQLHKQYPVDLVEDPGLGPPTQPALARLPGGAKAEFRRHLLPGDPGEELNSMP
jgi:hypothetical protein